MIDMVYFQIVLFLLIFGLLAIYSSTFYHKLFFPLGQKGDYFKASLKWAGIGLIVFAGAIFFPLSILRRELFPSEVYRRRPFRFLPRPFSLISILWLIFFSCILYNVIWVLFGRAEVKRETGFFQPQEFFKYAHLFLMAQLSEEKDKRKANFWAVFLSLLGTVVILWQKAVGVAVIFFVANFFILYLMRVRRIFLLAYFLSAFLSITLGALCFSYAQERFSKFWCQREKKVDLKRPSDWMKFSHQDNAQIAIASGGLFGRGFGQGRQKFGFLRLIHTDFIFANICEEMGFIGAVFILLLFFFLLREGLIIASKFSFGFEYLFTSGVSIILFLYLFTHILVGLNIIPCTGQPLPFISYGGTSLVSNLWATGTVLNISHGMRR